MEVIAADPSGIQRAARILRAGGLVAFPTETVYGLGADALNAAAVRRIFEVKGRPADNPLIVHVTGVEGLKAVAAALPPLAADLAARFWPGPLTVIVEAAPVVPAATTGGLATVAVRVPDHPVARALLEEAGVPVAAPSANRSGRPSPTTAGHVVADLGDAVDAVLDGGPCRVGVESTVVDARGRTPVVLREGAVTREDLALDATEGQDAAAEGHGGVAEGHERAGDAPAAAGEGQDATGAARPDLYASPGTRYRHYAPDCVVELVPAGQAWARARALAAGGRHVGVVAAGAETSAATGQGQPTVVTRFTDAADLARRLYETLRAAEDAGVDVLVVEAVAEEGIGRAVMDRLRRAASG